MHACPDSRGTAAEDCRREGCIRHRLTWAHQDRPKPRATRARLPERLGVQGQLTGKNAPTGVIRDIVGGPYHPPLWRCHSREAKQAIFARGARYIYVGYSRWALASTIVAFSQHGPARKQHLLRLLLRTLLYVCACCVFSWDQPHLRPHSNVTCAHIGVKEHEQPCRVSFRVSLGFL